MAGQDSKPQIKADGRRRPGAEMPIEFQCQCGAKLRAKEELAGKRLKCPKCSNALTIPEPDAPHDEMELGFDELADFESAASPLDRGDRSPKPSPNSSRLLIIVGIAAGVVALLLIVAVLMLTGGGADEIARNDSNPSSSQQPSSEDTTTPEEPFEEDDASEDDASEDDSAEDDRVEADSADGGDDVTAQADAEPSPHEDTKPAEDAEDQSELQVALHQWHGQSGALVGTRRVEDDESPLIMNYSWMCELLPFLGYQQLHDNFKFSNKWTEPQNLAVAAVVVPEFLNPEDPRHRWEGYPFQGLALTHFVGMSGVEDQRNVVAASLPRSDPRAGIFGYDEVAKADDVSDGLGKTIMIIGAGKIVAPWVQGGGSTIRGAREPYFDELTGFSLPSDKGKSTVAAFADGSVRRLSSDIDPRVFRAMCTAGGGESVDVDAVGPKLGPFPTRKRADFNGLQGPKREDKDP